MTNDLLAFILNCMENDCYTRLNSVLSKYPHVYQFLNEGFIKKQCKKGFKNYLLKCLEDEESSSDTNLHLPTLEKRLAELDSIAGYDRLEPCLQGASDWDEYQEFLAQMNITLWFRQKNLLKEIEPELPHRDGYTDMLLSYLQRDICCEVTSRQSPPKSMRFLRDNEVLKVQRLLSKQPWMTKQDAENEIEIDIINRKLLEKTKKQLPSGYPGIIAFDAGKGWVFHHQVKRVAKKLFPKRPQLMLVMLWTSERGSQIGEPPFWFVNSFSAYQNIAQKLLKYLGQDNWVLDCR